jgi:hypothetical protein
VLTGLQVGGGELLTKLAPNDHDLSFDHLLGDSRRAVLLDYHLHSLLAASLVGVCADRPNSSNEARRNRVELGAVALRPRRAPRR